MRAFLVAGWIGLVLVGLFAPTRALAAQEAALILDIKFVEGCSGRGFIRTVSSTPAGPFVEESDVILSWSAEQPIESTGFVPGIPDEFRFELVDFTTRRVLYETIIQPTRDDVGEEQLVLRTTLDCRTAPYREVLPDTSTGSDPGDVAGARDLTVFVTLCVVVAFAARQAWVRLREASS